MAHLTGRVILAPHLEIGDLKTIEVSSSGGVVSVTVGGETFVVVRKRLLDLSVDDIKTIAAATRIEVAGGNAIATDEIESYFGRVVKVAAMAATAP